MRERPSSARAHQGLRRAPRRLHRSLLGMRPGSPPRPGLEPGCGIAANPAGLRFMVCLLDEGDNPTTTDSPITPWRPVPAGQPAPTPRARTLSPLLIPGASPRPPTAIRAPRRAAPGVPRSRARVAPAGLPERDARCDFRECVGHAEGEVVGIAYRSTNRRVRRVAAPLPVSHAASVIRERSRSYPRTDQMSRSAQVTRMASRWLAGSSLPIIPAGSQLARDGRH